MQRKLDRPSADGLIATVTAEQHGVVERSQLLARGLGAGAVEYRLRCGRLHRVHRKVYSLAPPSTLRREGHWMAAVLTCGDGAVLSHAAAASLWDLRPSNAQIVDVTAPSYAGRSQQRGIRLHRSRTLDAAQRTIHNRIPVTTVARTLIDLADRFDRRTVERALDQAEVQRRFDLTSLEAALRANPGRRGSAVVQCLLAAYTIAEEMTESELEDQFLRLCDRFAIPRPAVGVTVEGLKVDFLWRHERLVAETDGWRWHGARGARERDHRRDITLQLRGFRVVRFSFRRILTQPAAVAADLARLLRS